MKRFLIATTFLCASALTAQAAPVSAPAEAPVLSRLADRLQAGAADTTWAQMQRRPRMRGTTMRRPRTGSRMNRRTMPRQNGGTAAGSAPNGRNFGLGPTGQPSGVK